MTRILIIDDEPDIRSTLRAILEIQGWQVDEADNGRSGIECIRQKGADLVITDILMPDTDGLETVREIQKAAPQIPIVAMSGGGHLTPDNFLKIAEHLGASRTFRKPFLAREVVDAIHELLDQARPA